MTTLSVNGMHCPNCAKSVKEALEKQGAGNVVVDLDNKCVSYDGCLAKEDAKDIIESQGFDVVL